MNMSKATFIKLCVFSQLKLCVCRNMNAEYEFSFLFKIISKPTISY